MSSCHTPIPICHFLRDRLLSRAQGSLEVSSQPKKDYFLKVITYCHVRFSIVKVLLTHMSSRGLLPKLHPSDSLGKQNVWWLSSNYYIVYEGISPRHPCSFIWSSFSVFSTAVSSLLLSSTVHCECGWVETWHFFFFKKAQFPLMPIREGKKPKQPKQFYFCHKLNGNPRLPHMMKFDVPVVVCCFSSCKNHLHHNNVTLLLHNYSLPHHISELTVR